MYRSITPQLVAYVRRRGPGRARTAIPLPMPSWQRPAAVGDRGEALECLFGQLAADGLVCVDEHDEVAWAVAARVGERLVAEGRSAVTPEDTARIARPEDTEPGL